jgi:hypothetical protein
MVACHLDIELYPSVLYLCSLGRSRVREALRTTSPWRVRLTFERLPFSGLLRQFAKTDAYGRRTWKLNEIWNFSRLKYGLFWNTATV